MIEKGASGLLSTRLQAKSTPENISSSQKKKKKSILFTLDMSFIAN